MMPLCDIQTNMTDINKEFVLQLRGIISHQIGKPMTMKVKTGVLMFVGDGAASVPGINRSDPIMLIQLHGAFIDDVENKQISGIIFECTSKELGIRTDRIGLVFHYLPPTHVGLSGGQLVQDFLPEARLKQLIVWRL